jgi:hypothetical protein
MVQINREMEEREREKERERENRYLSLTAEPHLHPITSCLSPLGLIY